MAIKLNPFTGSFDIISDVNSANPGSAASPGIYFVGDPDTGIYSPGADQVAISTGGSGRLFVNSSGVVTTDNNYTSARLNVVNANTVSTFDRMLLLRSDNLSNAFLGLGNDSFYIASATSAPIVFCTNSDGGASGTSVPTNERLRITSAGLVGVGTSSPATTLDVNGSAQVTGSVSGFGGGEIRLGPTTANTQSAITTQATGAPALIFDHRGTSNTGTFAWRNGTGGANSLMTLDGSGRLGIGTTGPTATVHANSGSASDVYFRSSNSLATTSLGTAADGSTYVYNSSAYPISFFTNATERARIDSSGRLGIGTSTPQASLDITSGTFQAVRTNLSSITDTFHQYRGTPDGVGYEHARVFSGRDTSVHTYGSYLAFYTEGKASGTTDTSLERLRIDSSGRVGIGTSAPGATLDISAAQGSIRVVSSTGTNYALVASQNGNGSCRLGVESSTGGSLLTGASAYSSILCSSSSHSLHLGTNATTALTIDTSQRVGIGITSPGNTLHLAGTNGVGQRIENTSNSISAYSTLESSGALQANISGSGFFSWVTGGGEKVRIDNSGRLLVGTSSARTFGTTGSAPLLEVESSTNPSLSITRTGADQYGSYLGLGKIRSTSIVNSGDDIGIIGFEGYDGSALKPAASITAQVDGTPGANDMPGRLVFSTTADGASSPTERMRLTSTGQLRLAGAGITFNGDTATANELDDYEEGTWTPVYSGTWTTTPTNSSARYTKIGRLVHIAFSFTGGAKSSATSGWVTGLPFESHGATAAGGGTGRLSDTSVSDRGLIVVYDSRLFLTATTFDAATNYCDAVYTVA